MSNNKILSFVIGGIALIALILGFIGATKKSGTTTVIREDGTTEQLGGLVHPSLEVFNEGLQLDRTKVQAVRRTILSGAHQTGVENTGSQTRYVFAADLTFASTAQASSTYDAYVATSSAATRTGTGAYTPPTNTTWNLIDGASFATSSHPRVASATSTDSLPWQPGEFLHVLIVEHFQCGNATNPNSPDEGNGSCDSATSTNNGLGDIDFTALYHEKGPR